MNAKGSWGLQLVGKREEAPLPLLSDSSVPGMSGRRAAGGEAATSAPRVLLLLVGTRQKAGTSTSVITTVRTSR